MPANALHEAAAAITDGAEANPLTGWHANVQIIQRCHFVLLVHDVIRFDLFIPGLTKADFAKLAWHFADMLMNTLLKTGASEAQLVFDALVRCRGRWIR
ncbi:MAG: hypothetical protein LPD71_08185 [Shewanella sp.]|nr:hypothetical protein [Shewanella sp.]MCF1431722.1 hypothetical protein [Shewanella sp.]MCF1438710.1 hypothetical protein [Shewanella sp.]MCF1457246.1 hypothetical protein [Shewanella sp.]